LAHNRRDVIEVAAGRRPADVVLKNARIVNVASHEVQAGDVALAGDRIAGIGTYEGVETLDLSGRYVCPGFFDAHVHIESSMLTPGEFARVAAACGTTAIAADPHEFANVVGEVGITYVVQAAEAAPLDIFVMLSSCVPASPLERAGATLEAADLAPLLEHSRVLGLAEMMNYPGVINASDDVLAKLDICKARTIDGHAPAVTGQWLTAYVSAGIMSDHESISAEEAAEKLRNGLFIMIREGSQTRNLAALLPLVRPETADRFMFCTDDKDVRDLLEEGQIDYMIRTAIASGMDPILAIRLATLNTARYFGLRDAGAVLPGYIANLTVLDDLKHCRVTEVFHRGRLVARDGACTLDRTDAPLDDALRSTVRLPELNVGDLAPDAPAGAAAPKVHVMHVLEHRIDTERSIEPAAVRDGKIVADPQRDLAKIVSIDRYGTDGRIGIGFVRGFQLSAGAIATTVAHDAHNLTVVGMSDKDMLVAARRAAETQGGQVVVLDGRVLAACPLPVCGLVSDKPAGEVARQLEAISEAARSLGCRLEQPFMALSFLSLSVIGKLKVTTVGLVDVERFEAIPLLA